MALLQNVIAKGTHAARPAAGSAGVLYYETDVYKLFRDNGSSWDEIDLTAAVITQGQLAQARGGTGIDSSAATNGQLLIGKTSDGSLNLATLTAGSNITITNAAGAITVAAASSTSAVTQLAQTVLGSAAASITFSSISGSYSSLLVTLDGRSDTTSPNMLVQLNSDTAANYDYSLVRGNGNAGAFTDSAGATSIRIGTLGGTDAVANVSTSFEFTVLNYAGTTFHKTLRALSNFKFANSSTNIHPDHWSGFWRSTSAITAIKLFPASGNLITGSVATLYGLT